MKKTYIKGISNYYGTLVICEFEDKYYWMIENYDTCDDNIEDYQEITEELYNSLVKFNNYAIS